MLALRLTVIRVAATAAITEVEVGAVLGSQSPLAKILVRIAGVAAR